MTSASENPETPSTGKKTDETWKEKAQREKERLADSPRTEREHRLPPASFLGIVEELSVRAMLALGQLRNPATGEVYLDLEAAKYAVDLLGVLEQKTTGQLDAVEQRALGDALHTLRLLFVQVSRNPPAVDAYGQVVEPGAEMMEEEGTEPGPEGRGPKIIL